MISICNLLYLCGFGATLSNSFTGIGIQWIIVYLEMLEISQKLVGLSVL